MRVGLHLPKKGEEREGHLGWSHDIWVSFKPSFPSFPDRVRTREPLRGHLLKSLRHPLSPTLPPLLRLGPPRR